MLKDFPTVSGTAQIAKDFSVLHENLNVRLNTIARFHLFVELRFANKLIDP